MADAGAATDVVIVGSGPTGLMAAALLTRCGVKVRILDKTEQQAHESRAFGVQARSMELFLSLGLADELLNRGLIATGVDVYARGERAGGFNFDDIGRADTPYSFVLMCPQREIEAILVEDLHRLGVMVEHNVEATGFEQSADGVVVHAHNTKSGAALDVRCAYLIGADGAHSMVRHGLGLKYEGAAYAQGFYLADCKVRWPLDHAHVKIFLGKPSLAAFLPLKGTEVSRVIAIQPVGLAKDAALETQGASEVSLTEVEAAFREASGIDVTLSDPVWLTRYRVHHRGVDRYGVGRVFVAGDAAHIHSPVGGQGMNTGLQDAANLAWKIAAVLKGRAPAGLLDTYHSERWPIGQKILNYTDRMFTALSSQSNWVASLRNMVVPLFAATLSKSGTMRARAFHFLSQLGIHYHESDYVRDGSTPDAPKSWREGLSVGRRAPDAVIARGTDIFALIGGYRFHVLALSRKPLSEDEIAALTTALAGLPKSVAGGMRLESHIIAHSLVGRDPRLVQAETNQPFLAFGLDDETPQALFLIRPDGYIAYRANRLDVAGLKEFLGQRFGAAG